VRRHPIVRARSPNILEVCLHFFREGRSVSLPVRCAPINHSSPQQTLKLVCDTAEATQGPSINRLHNAEAVRWRHALG
jgi:hypothetical protein